MRIQSSLVFDKHSNELIGFVDLGDNDVNVAAFDSRSVIQPCFGIYDQGCSKWLEVYTWILQHRECYILPTDGIILESCFHS